MESILVKITISLSRCSYLSYTNNLNYTCNKKLEFLEPYQEEKKDIPISLNQLSKIWLESELDKGSTFDFTWSKS